MKSLFKIYSIILLLLPLGLFAQQWLEFSQESQYSLYQNPALSGFDSKLDVALAHRSQYVGVADKAISSQYVGVSAPLLSPKFGIGLRMVNDFIGYQRYTLIDVAGAYHLSFGKSKLSLGLGLGVVNLAIDGTKLRAAEGNYAGGVVVHNDDFIPNTKASAVTYTTSFGLNYHINNFNGGFAFQNLNSPKIKLSSEDFGTFVQISRTINVYGSYVIEAGKINFVPYISIKSDFKKTQTALQLGIDLKKMYFGVGYRGFDKKSNDAFIGTIRFKIKEKIEVGYSYDYNTSFLTNFNSGNHEIGIRYIMPIRFSQKQKGNTWYNPRFL